MRPVKDAAVLGVICCHFLPRAAAEGSDVIRDRLNNSRLQTLRVLSRTATGAPQPQRDQATGDVVRQISRALRQSHGRSLLVWSAPTKQAADSRLGR